MTQTGMKRRRFPRNQKSQGVALITAMLVMSLAALTAASLASRQFLDFRRIENMIYYEQAYMHALSAELVSREVLYLATPASKYDSQVDMAGVSGPIMGHLMRNIDSDQVDIAWRGINLEGRFNLNNLVGDDGKPVEREKDRLRRIMNAVFAAHEQAPSTDELINAIVDWIDPDTETTFAGGAEEDTYMLQGYRPANRMMASATELLLVQGFRERPILLYGGEVDDALSGEKKTVEGLFKYVTALPDNKATININFASDVVKKSLSHHITDEIVAKLQSPEKENNPRPGFESVQGFTELVFREVPEPADATEKAKFKAELDESLKGLDVQSSYFMMVTDVKVGNVSVTLNSMLYRDTGARSKPLVLSRTQGTLRELESEAQSDVAGLLTGLTGLP